MKEGNFNLAQEWMWKLKGRKPNHLGMILGRPSICDAMDAVIQFTGLWDDLRLGNWAKHLAAHCDLMIVHYWKHIHDTWTKIFAGVESSPSLLDPWTVQCLQYRAPAWSNGDRTFITKSMRWLFGNITSSRCRARLLENILRLDVVIPSILTFDENMRYITVGAKILEKHIEVKPKKEHRSTPKLLKEPSCLYKNLTRNWDGCSLLETKAGQFSPYIGQSDSWAAFADLLLTALRDFPYLSSVSPLQDVKGEEMIAAPHQDSLSWLCRSAEIRGFRNEKIAEGVKHFQHRGWFQSPKSSNLYKEWRGGMPSIQQFWALKSNFYLPFLANLDTSETLNPDHACIQRDFVGAFFGCLPRIDMDTAQTTVIALRWPGQTLEDNMIRQADNMMTLCPDDGGKTATDSGEGAAADSLMVDGVVDAVQRPRATRAEGSRLGIHTIHKGTKASVVKEVYFKSQRKGTKLARRHMGGRTSSVFAPDIPETRTLPLESNEAVTSQIPGAQIGSLLPDPQNRPEQIDEVAVMGSSAVGDGGPTTINRLEPRNNQTVELQRVRPAGITDVSQLPQPVFCISAGQPPQNGADESSCPPSPETPPDAVVSFNVHRTHRQSRTVVQNVRLSSETLIGAVSEYLDRQREAFSSISLTKVKVGGISTQLSPLDNIWSILKNKFLLSREILEKQKVRVIFDVSVCDVGSIIGTRLAPETLTDHASSPAPDVAQVAGSSTVVEGNTNPVVGAEQIEARRIDIPFVAAHHQSTDYSSRLRDPLRVSRNAVRLPVQKDTDRSATLKVKARRLDGGEGSATVVENVTTGPSQTRGVGGKRGTEDTREVEIRRGRYLDTDMDLRIPEPNEPIDVGRSAIDDIIEEEEEY